MDFSLISAPVNLSGPTLTILPSIEAKLPIRKTPAATGRIDRAELRARLAKVMARNLKTTLHCVNTAKEWAVIGGGASINDEVDNIRRMKRMGVAIVSVNKSHDWLLERGIVPWAHVLLDPKEWVADYVKRPRKDVRYFVASQCHERVFDALEGCPVFLWHAGQDFPEDNVAEPDSYLREHCPPEKGHTWQIVPGGTTVGMRTPMLGHHMIDGVDAFHMFGMDSSRGPEGKMHGYDKPEPPDAARGRHFLFHKGRRYWFDTNSHMSRQFEDFDNFLKDLKGHFDAGRMRRGFRMRFYGSGLLPFYAAQLGLHADPECNKDPTTVGGYLPQEAAPVPKMGDLSKLFVNA